MPYSNTASWSRWESMGAICRALFLAGQVVTQEPQPVQSSGEMTMAKFMPGTPVMGLALVPAGAAASSSSVMAMGRMTAWGHT